MQARATVLAICLAVLPLRRSMAEDRVDFTVGYYLEDHHRVDVWTSALLWETEVTPHTTMRLQGVYDVVSGASPTGAPPTQKTRTVTKEVTASVGGAQVITGYNVVSGPTGTPPTYVPIFATVGAETTTTRAPCGSGGALMRTAPARVRRCRAGTRTATQSAARR
jgi:hypothetical protein